MRLEEAVDGRLCPCREERDPLLHHVRAVADAHDALAGTLELRDRQGRCGGMPRRARQPVGLGG